MNLDEVIEYLTQQREIKGGDMPVFVNGVRGEKYPELAEEEHFSIGEAIYTLGGDLPHGIRQRDIVMQIGGYE
jgi:hypothetical protein